MKEEWLFISSTLNMSYKHKINIMRDSYYEMFVYNGYPLSFNMDLGAFDIHQIYQTFTSLPKDAQRTYVLNLEKACASIGDLRLRITQCSPEKLEHEFSKYMVMSVFENMEEDAQRDFILRGTFFLHIDKC